MKKIRNIFCLLLLMSILLSGISIAETTNEKTKIQITPENFSKYFALQFDKRVTSEAWSSRFVPGKFYDVECDITATVTALIPCEIYDFSFAVDAEFWCYDEIVLAGNMVYSDISFSFIMPPSGVCTANKFMEWTVDINPYSKAGQDEAETCGIGKKEYRIKSGYILVDNSYLQGLYDEAIALKDTGNYEDACGIFENITDYNDSAEQLDACKNELLKANYQNALALKNAGNYEEAIAAFKSLGDYKDSSEQLEACKNEMLNAKYQNAMSLKEAGEYEEAIVAFEALGNYEDSAEQITLCKEGILKNEYENALSLKEAGNYNDAIAAFEALGDFSDSKEQIQLCKDAILKNAYDEALTLKKNEEYDKAIDAFKLLNGYADSTEQINECIYDKAAECMIAGDYSKAYEFYVSLKGYKDVDTLLSTDENLRSITLTEYTDKDTIKATQTALNAAGYDCGKPDGIAGKRTATAATQCQTDMGLNVTGTITHELLIALGVIAE